MSEINDEFQKDMEEKFHSMKDNTQINDDEKKLRVAKLNMPANVVDFLMDHYGFFDLVELNTLCFYVLKSLAHMEKDGFKLAIYKSTDDKVESYELDIHELIAKFRIQMAQSINKEKNEKDSV